jgi:hypothetical protein
MATIESTRYANAMMRQRCPVRLSAYSAARAVDRLHRYASLAALRGLATSTKMRLCSVWSGAPVRDHPGGRGPRAVPGLRPTHGHARCSYRGRRPNRRGGEVSTADHALRVDATILRIPPPQLLSRAQGRSSRTYFPLRTAFQSASYV